MPREGRMHPRVDAREATTLVVLGSPVATVRQGAPNQVPEWAKVGGDLAWVCEQITHG